MTNRQLRGYMRGWQAFLRCVEGHISENGTTKLNVVQSGRHQTSCKKIVVFMICFIFIFKTFPLWSWLTALCRTRAATTTVTHRYYLATFVTMRAASFVNFTSTGVRRCCCCFVPPSQGSAASTIIPPAHNRNKGIVILFSSSLSSFFHFFFSFFF